MDQFRKPYSSLTAWEHRFLNLAEYHAQWSKDPSTQVGAIIAVDRRQLGQGYNGFPKGVNDSDERLSDRDLKYPMTVHAEANAIVIALSNAPYAVEGSTIYTWPFMPCPNCAGLIIQAGISKVIAPYSDNARWMEQWHIASKMFKEAGVDVLLCEHV